MKRIGMICRSDNSGLGTLSWEFAQHLRPSKILLVANGVFHTFPERYEGFDVRKVDPHESMSEADKEWLTKDIDVLISFETFYDWSIITYCRRRKVKSVLITMFEMTPIKLFMYPDVFLCPSKLDYEYFVKMLPGNTHYLPIPVNTNKLVWKERKQAKTFVHSASHGGVAGRKGTALLLDAMKYVKSGIDLLIYSWQPVHAIGDKRIQVKLQNFKNYWQVWKEGDVLVYPQDYNGICLPIVEAMASGLGVITTDIFPFNEYMQKDLMFEHDGLYKTRAHHGLIEVDAAKINPKKIAEKIDQIAFQDISKYSQYGREWAKENSWEKLLPKYKKFIESL